MPASKIVDEQEVLRWFEEGRTYEWMCQEYRRKYDVETVPSLWGNFRRRRGLVRRTVRDDNLIPWAVREEHRYKFPVRMLRLEARARAGEPIREADALRHRNFMAHLQENGLVIAYLPDTEEGFVYTPRLPSDDDVIRRPASANARTSRHAAV